MAGVQEGVWPDLRPGASLLGAEDLVDVAARRRPGSLDRRTLAWPRSAAVLRGGHPGPRRLVVTAVDAGLDGGDVGANASRFLDLVAPPPADGDGVRPHTPLRGR